MKECKQCGHKFEGTLGNPNKYCSKDCADKALHKHKLLDCINCGNQLTRKQTGKFIRNKRYKEKKGKEVTGPFCSLACSNDWKKVPKLDRVCKNCGKTFKKNKWDVENHDRGHFCSKECSAGHYGKIRSENARTECKCEKCGKKFTELKNYVENYGRGKYCSKECAELGSRNRVETSCANCGKNIEVIESRHKENNYCSKSCAYQGMRVYNTCDLCGKKYWVYERGDAGHKYTRRKYCSKECTTLSQRVREKKECENCGSEYEARPSDMRTNCKRCRNKQPAARQGSVVLTKEEYARVISKFQARKNVRNLRDVYVSRVIQASHKGIKSKDIPKELIELKRLNIKRKRIIKKKKTYGNSQ